MSSFFTSREKYTIQVWNHKTRGTDLIQAWRFQKQRAFIIPYLNWKMIIQWWNRDILSVSSKLKTAEAVFNLERFSWSGADRRGLKIRTRGLFSDFPAYQIRQVRVNSVVNAKRERAFIFIKSKKCQYSDFYLQISDLIEIGRASCRERV